MVAAAEGFRMVEVLVGNTPLLAIHYRYRGSERVIHAKAEQLNLTGSVKDRMALNWKAAGWRPTPSSPAWTRAAR
jgi:cysteine synthase A